MKSFKKENSVLNAKSKLISDSFLKVFEVRKINQMNRCVEEFDLSKAILSKVTAQDATDKELIKGIFDNEYHGYNLLLETLDQFNDLNSIVSNQIDLKSETWGQ